MLDTLRANSRSVLTYVLFGIIIIVFVISFGPSSKGCSAADLRSTGYAAKVNGESITAADFDRSFRDAVSRGASPNDPNVRAQILKNLETRELIYQEALAQGVQVSDEDLAREIEQLPGFQVEGKFDQDLYTRRTAEMYGSRGQFEQRMRHDLTISRMIAVVGEVITVPEDEVKQAWQNQNDKVNVSFVRFSSAPEPSKLTDAEVNAFVAANGPRIEKFFKDNPSRFQKPKQVKVQHILIKVDRDAPKSADQEAKKKIEDLAARVAKGDDFGKLAQEFSEDPGSKDRAGEMPPFGPGVMVKEFEQAAFALKPGQVSQPVRSPFGWHLIKAQSIIDPVNVTLDKAKPEIGRELLAQDVAEKSAKEQAEQTLAKLKKGESLSALFPSEEKAKEKDPKKPLAKAPAGNSPKVQDSGLFSLQGDWVPNAGQVANLGADAFQHNAGDVLPKTYSAAGSIIVAVVKERQRPDPSQYAAKKDEIAKRLRQVKAAQMESTWLDGLRKKAKVVENQAYVQAGPANVPLDME